MKNSRPSALRLFIKTWRPDSFWDVLGAHLPFFIVSGLPLLFAHTMELQSLPLVPCLVLEIYGFPCPFCGYTRSFWAMASGDVMFAFKNCPLACALYMTCIIIFTWNAGAILSGMRVSPGKLFRRIPQKPAWIFLVCLVLVNWGYRLTGGLK